MPRSPAVAGKPYSIVVPVKLNEPGVEALDGLRGTTSRSEFFRNLLREETIRRKGRKR